MYACTVSYCSVFEVGIKILWCQCGYVVCRKKNSTWNFFSYILWSTTLLKYVYYTQKDYNFPEFSPIAVLQPLYTVWRNYRTPLMIRTPLIMRTLSLLKSGHLLLSMCVYHTYVCIYVCTSVHSVQTPVSHCGSRSHPGFRHWACALQKVHSLTSPAFPARTCVIFCSPREVKVHVSKGGMSYTILNQLHMTKKKQGPMDQLLYTLKLKKVCFLVN